MIYDLRTMAVVIRKACKSAKLLRETQDGGSCNFDSVYIPVPRMTQKQVDELQSLSGVSLSLRTSGWQGRRIHINCGEGQANRNTVMAEECCKSLQSDGLDAHMYYMLD